MHIYARYIYLDKGDEKMQRITTSAMLAVSIMQ